MTGEFDFVAICEAPDDAVMARYVLQLGSLGFVRTKTLKALPEPHTAKSSARSAEPRRGLTVKDVPTFVLIDSAVCCTSLANPSDRGPEGRGAYGQRPEKTSLREVRTWTCRTRTSHLQGHSKR